MSRLLLKRNFVPFTRGAKVALSVLVLVYLAIFAMFSGLAGTGIAFVFVFSQLVVMGIILSIFFAVRRSQNVKIFEDRVEVRSKFLVESIKRIEASKIEAVSVTDTPFGQKNYGSVLVTGSGGSRILITPVANQAEVAETIRSISSAATQKPQSATLSGDLAEQLSKLDSLYRAGVLSDQEYAAAKAKVIN